MMFRLVRFLIISLTLGRIKWLMRLTWVWRLVVFLGITGWLSKRLRRAIGLDKTKTSQMDSAWAEALRYTPTPASASPSGVRSSDTAPLVSESVSEVTGIAADGSEETITLHEVSVEGETETIVRIADDAGHVETIVTGAPVEEIDLANLGSGIDQETVEELIEAEIESESAVDAILDTLEAAEPEPETIELAAADNDELDLQPEVDRTAMVESAPPAEPAEDTELELLIDPDWVRGDGTLDCPDSHPVKAKASSMIYYTPESGHYGRTIADVCFASELDAEASGYRPPRR